MEHHEVSNYLDDFFMDVFISGLDHPLLLSMRLCDQWLVRQDGVERSHVAR
jgi:hypothetical protein